MWLPVECPAESYAEISEHKFSYYFSCYQSIELQNAQNPNPSNEFGSAFWVELVIQYPNTPDSDLHNLVELVIQYPNTPGLDLQVLVEQIK